MTSEPLAAIVLAAGSSQRMGSRNKLLLPLDGKPLVAHVVEAAAQAVSSGASRPAGSPAGQVVVVTGHERGRVEAALDGLAQRNGLAPIRFAHNAAFRDGMASSLRCGVAAAPAEAGGYLLCLGDQPRVTARALRLLCERFRQSASPGAIATFAGVPGPPVLFGRAHRAALLRLEGDTGAQPLLRRHAEAVLTVAPSEAGLSPGTLAADADTPAAYRRLLDGP